MDLLNDLKDGIHKLKDISVTNPLMDTHIRNKIDTIHRGFDLILKKYPKVQHPILSQHVKERSQSSEGCSNSMICGLTKFARSLLKIKYFQVIFSQFLLYLTRNKNSLDGSF